MTDVVIAQKAPYAIDVEAGKVIFGAPVEEAPTNPFAMAPIKALTFCPSSILQRLIGPCTFVVVRRQKKRRYAMALTTSFNSIASTSH